MKNIKKSDVISIFDDDIVTVTKMNHIVEVQHMDKMNIRANIKKLDKNRYVDLRTGEIKEYKHFENRSQSENSLKQTFKKLRYLINNNFTGAKNELFITLTYEENMTYTERLYTDFDKFIKRLRYKYRDRSTIDYISVVEPQDRGAWHCHVLFRFNDLKTIYIPNKFEDKKPVDAPLYELWGHGWVTIRSLKNVDNVGAYLSAYLTDIELNEDTSQDVINKTLNEEHRTIKTIDNKKYIKGGRLHLYPPGMNLYRTSRGIKKPDRMKMKYKNAKKIVGSAKPHYFKSYDIKLDDFENTISYLQYNLKRQ